jgi:pantothenate kinase type III
MPNTIFRIYNNEPKANRDSNERLLLEIGNSHLAAILTHIETKSVEGFELFTFKENEAENTDDLFHNILSDSSLLSGVREHPGIL